MNRDQSKCDLDEAKVKVDYKIGMSMQVIMLKEIVIALTPLGIDVLFVGEVKIMVLANTFALSTFL